MGKNRDQRKVTQQTQGINVNDQTKLETSQDQEANEVENKVEGDVSSDSYKEAITVLSPQLINVELSEIPAYVKEKSQQAEREEESKRIAEQIKPEGKFAAALTPAVAAPTVTELYNVAAKKLKAEPTPVAKPADLLAENPFKTVGAKLVFEEFKHYVDALSTKRVTLTPHQGGVLQSSLYRALVGAVNAPAEEHTQVMDLVLTVIEERLTTVFSPASIFRFMDSLPIPHSSVQHFRMLTNMFIAMAPVKSRGLAIKQSGLPGVLNSRSITEEGRQRTLGYFGL